MKQWMRKCMAAGFLAAFSTLAAADTIAGLYAGAGVWSAGPGGNIGAPRSMSMLSEVTAGIRSRIFPHKSPMHSTPSWTSESSWGTADLP